MAQLGAAPGDSTFRVPTVHDSGCQPHAATEHMNLAVRLRNSVCRLHSNEFKLDSHVWLVATYRKVQP